MIYLSKTLTLNNNNNNNMDNTKEFNINFNAAPTTPVFRREEGSAMQVVHCSTRLSVAIMINTKSQ